MFDGILDLLDDLERDGWLLAVATGKSDRGLKHCLEKHGVHARFVSLQTADRHPSKPHPSMALQAMADAGAGPETTIVIGDTSYDMGMARAAGATGIGAGWGYHEPSELLGGRVLGRGHDRILGRWAHPRSSGTTASRVRTMADRSPHLSSAPAAHIGTYAYAFSYRTWRFS